jgi:hypothetical protein
VNVLAGQCQWQISWDLIHQCMRQEWAEGKSV